MLSEMFQTLSRVLLPRTEQVLQFSLQSLSTTMLPPGEGPQRVLLQNPCKICTQQIRGLKKLAYYESRLSSEKNVLMRFKRLNNGLWIHNKPTLRKKVWRQMQYGGECLSSFLGVYIKSSM